MPLGQVAGGTRSLCRTRIVLLFATSKANLIFAKLSREGYKELSRAKIIEPTQPVMRRQTVWSHPAFAMQSVFARNDGEFIRVILRSNKRATALRRETKAD